MNAMNADPSLWKRKIERRLERAERDSRQHVASRQGVLGFGTRTTIGHSYPPKIILFSSKMMQVLILWFVLMGCTFFSSITNEKYYRKSHSVPKKDQV